MIKWRAGTIFSGGPGRLRGAEAEAAGKEFDDAVWKEGVEAVLGG